LRARRGLDAGRFAREFGGPPRQFYAPAIEELVSQGLLEEGGAGAPGDLRLTARGRRFSDGVFEHFV
jgi:coproporphyrinogen III oxidase-like Fe-S oxidoreductase